MEFSKNQLFIIGYPKSGTTLLINLLDGHPEIFNIPEETRFFLTVVPGLPFLSKKSKSEKINFIISTLFEKSSLRNLKAEKVENSLSGNFDYSDFDYDAFEKLFRKKLAASDLSPAVIFKNLLVSFRETSSLNYGNETFSYFVEKTPRHSQRIDEILDVFPDAKFLQIIRDPRDNWVSYKKKKGDWLNIYSFCYYWKEAVENAFLNSKKLGSEKYMYINYEDLVVNPKLIMSQVTDFLGIENHPSILLPTRYGKPWQGNSMWGERNKKNEISVSAIGRYKKWKKQDEIEIIEILLSKYFKIFDYERSFFSRKLWIELKFLFFNLRKGASDLLYRNRERKIKRLVRETT